MNSGDELTPVIFVRRISGFVRNTESVQRTMINGKPEAFLTDKPIATALTRTVTQFHKTNTCKKIYML